MEANTGPLILQGVVRYVDAAITRLMSDVQLTRRHSRLRPKLIHRTRNLAD